MNEEEKIWNLKEELNKNKLNIDNIRRQIKQLSEFDEKQNYDYLNALLYPEKMKGVRIPSKTPMPTCAFQLRSTINITPLNTSQGGKMLLVVTPFFLGYPVNRDPMDFNIVIINNSNQEVNKIISVETLYPSSYLTGIGNSTMSSLNLNQFIDENVYNVYRLVSASLNVSYIGSLDQAQGILGGGISIGNSNYMTGSYRINYNGEHYISGFNNLTLQYKDFNLVRQLPYYRETNILDGLRMLYFPIDNKSLEFKKVFTFESIYQDDICRGNTYNDVRATLLIGSDDYDRRFSWVIIGEQLPVGNKSIKLDLCCNFECVPNASLLNYIPISINTYYISERDLIKIWKKIKGKCVDKLINN